MARGCGLFQALLNAFALRRRAASRQDDRTKQGQARGWALPASISKYSLHGVMMPHARAADQSGGPETKRSQRAHD
ncbi:hypothetical protein C41B8_17224 [Salinisphaera hydrothermalis C41B8]|uniref:Uncharacterized protein n=1 Tax=Salinisphaera hydrothermalis (strain C41B8) TaxID=1304275 RepID=A0A084IH11_SALHC|nr:hypothetical protein C41B8_17224 [Salinisphaera hydrothermalis C41B8]